MDFFRRLCLFFGVAVAVMTMIRPINTWGMEESISDIWFNDPIKINCLINQATQKFPSEIGELIAENYLRELAYNIVIQSSANKSEVTKSKVDALRIQLINTVKNCVIDENKNEDELYNMIVGCIEKKDYSSLKKDYPDVYDFCLDTKNHYSEEVHRKKIYPRVIFFCSDRVKNQFDKYTISLEDLGKTEVQQALFARCGVEMSKTCGDLLRLFAKSPVDIEHYYTTRLNGCTTEEAKRLVEQCDKLKTSLHNHARQRRLNALRSATCDHYIKKCTTYDQLQGIKNYIQEDTDLLFLSSNFAQQANYFWHTTTWKGRLKRGLYYFRRPYLFPANCFSFGLGAGLLAILATNNSFIRSGWTLNIRGSLLLGLVASIFTVPIPFIFAGRQMNFLRSIGYSDGVNVDSDGRGSGGEFLAFYGLYSVGFASGIYMMSKAKNLPCLGW